MIRTIKAMSVLLAYPSAELKAAAPEIADALRQEALLGPERLAGIDALLAELADEDLYDIEERYVALFDRSRTLSLCLFEHVHGESRDRGSAMLDLLETYRAAGFEPVGTELPDHLPILLEFLSQRPLAEGRAMLADAAHILEALRQRLERRGTAYAAVLAALVDLAAEGPAPDSLEPLKDEPDVDPDDLEAIDAAWEESEVTFGPDPNAGCPATRDMLARMETPRNPDPARAPATQEA